MKNGIIVLISLLLLCLSGCAAGNESIDINDIKMVITQDAEFRSKTTDDNQLIEGYPSCVIYDVNSMEKYVSFINGLRGGMQYVGEHPVYNSAITIWYVHNNGVVEEYIFGVNEENNYIEYVKPDGESKITISQTVFDELFKIMTSETQFTYLIDAQDPENVVAKYKELCLTCEGVPSLKE